MPQSTAQDRHASRPTYSGQASAPTAGNRSYADANRNRSYADSNRNRTYSSASSPSRTAQGYNGSGYNDRRFANRDGDSRDFHGASRDYRRDGDRDHDRWDRNWRNDRRYDWHDYRNRHRSTFHLGFYYAPYSYWSYRPLSIGFYLDSLFYSSRYWIDDPWRYRLPEVYGPYRWIRYYDDALLVDIYTGEVVDVIHNFFW